MCRGVKDNETFSWYLGELRKKRISNYGVSGYSLDQTLLRLKKNYLNDPSKIVVLALNSFSMAQNCSVYNNYLNPGDILAVKPRFVISKKSGELKFIKYPFNSKNELLKLKDYKSYFNKYDGHQNFWRKKKFKYFFNDFPKKVIKKIGIDNLYDLEDDYNYKMNFWKTEEKLFLELLALFQKLSHDLNFKPVFLIQHSKKIMEYQRSSSKNQLSWIPVIIKAKKKFPNILFIDEVEIFANYKNIDELYTNINHSAKANYIIAKFLNNYF